MREGKKMISGTQLAFIILFLAAAGALGFVGVGQYIEEEREKRND